MKLFRNAISLIIFSASLNISAQSQSGTRDYPIRPVPFTSVKVTDAYKIIEGASYSLQTTPDLLLSARIDTLIEMIQCIILLSLLIGFQFKNDSTATNFMDSEDFFR